MDNNESTQEQAAVVETAVSPKPATPAAVVQAATSPAASPFAVSAVESVEDQVRQEIAVALDQALARPSHVRAAAAAGVIVNAIKRLTA